MAHKDDLRIQKTYRALFDALSTLLAGCNFNSITVNDLCAEALVSRATFYTHFNDKYDLLRYFLLEIRKSIIKDVYKYQELEDDINEFLRENKRIIRNILRDANGETLKIVREFMSEIVGLAIKRDIDADAASDHVILFNFFIGGLVNHLTWLVENNFPPEITMMNTYLYQMLETLTVWDAEQELGRTVLPSTYNQTKGGGAACQTISWKK